MSDAELYGQDDLHEARRERLARDSYIAWRMQDVPAIYRDLMPFSYDAKELWQAEKSIRAQLVEDQKLLASPWRRLGPPSTVLDDSNMTAHELLVFAVEVSIPIGHRDIPKSGRRDDPEVAAQMQFWSVHLSDDDRVQMRSMELFDQLQQENDPDKIEKIRRELNTLKSSPRAAH
jgi:hypothetical protein